MIGHWWKFITEDDGDVRITIPEDETRSSTPDPNNGERVSTTVEVNTAAACNECTSNGARQVNATLVLLNGMVSS